LKEKPQVKSSREDAAEVKAGTVDSARFQSRDNIQEGVFVLAGDSAVWKPVKTGLSSERQIEIINGIASGDTVISGPYRVLAKDLTSGAKVKVRKEGETPGKKGKA
jgi:hypothetical protein